MGRLPRPLHVLVLHWFGSGDDSRDNDASTIGPISNRGYRVERACNSWGLRRCANTLATAPSEADAEDRFVVTVVLPFSEVREWDAAHPR